MSSDEVLVTASSGFNEFATSIVVNMAIGLIAILIISLLRRRLTYYFDARRSDHLRNPGYIKGSTYLERPPRQSDTFFGWIWQTMNIPETVLLRSCGPDAVVTLRWMLRMGLYLTIYSITSFIILVPIQVSSADNNGTTGFNALSILSIDDGDNKLWCHLIFLYVFSALLFKLLHVTWMEVLDLKARWLSNEQLLGHKLTVFVHSLPPQYSTSASLYALFDEFYPGQVSGAYAVQNNGRLSQLYSLRENCVNQINSAKGKIELSQAKAAVKNIQSGPDGKKIKVQRPQMKTKTCGGQKVDTITHFEEKLREYDTEITSILNQINDKQYHTVAIIGKAPDETISLDETALEKEKRLAAVISSPQCGFVTFTSAVTASSVLNVPVSTQLNNFKIELAPEPQDISWFGINKSPSYKYIAGAIMHVIHFLLVVFWAVPVTFLSALLSIEVLSSTFPWLAPVLTFSPIVQGILSGLLPSLALIIFMALLPKILHAMGFLKGLESQSKIAMYVFRKYFVFQLVNFFLVACISSTFLKELQSIIQNPSDIPTLLARGLPQSSLLFVNYIMMRAFYTNIFSILDPVDIILNYVKYLFSSTPSAALTAIAPSCEQYQKNLPESALILIICFTFGTIQPIVLVFGACYFLTLTFSKRFSMLWVTVNPYQTGGGFWPLLFNRIMFGVIIGQLCMLGIFALKSMVALTILVIPLILLSLWFWYRFCNLYKSTEHRITLTSSRFTDFALDSLTLAQKNALEGYDLPAGPVYLSLLPYLMKDLCGDTLAHEKLLNNQQIVDKSTSPDLSLYSSLIPQQAEVFSGTQDKNITVSRDFVQLPAEYHGDDPTLKQLYKDWLLYHDTISFLPRQSLLHGLVPKKWNKPIHSAEFEEKIAAINKLNKEYPAHDSGNDVEGGVNNDDTSGDDTIDDFAYSPSIEQRILLEQQVVRYQRSQRIRQLHNAVQRRSIDDSINNSSNDTTNRLKKDESSSTSADQKDEVDTFTSTHLYSKIDSSTTSGQIELQLVQLVNTLHDIPQFSTEFTPFSPAQLESETMGLRRSVSSESITTTTRKVKAICSYVNLPPTSDLEQVMMRYFTPQTNPRHYSKVYNRVWGPTYLAYYQLKKAKAAKEEKA